MIAKKWFRKGCALTSATKGVELRTQGNGDRKKVTATCALGAMQVGYVADVAKRRGGNPTSADTVRFFVRNANDFWPEVDKICTAYENRYGVRIQDDNDLYGREFVAGRLVQL